MEEPPFKLGEPRYDQVPHMICEVPLLCIAINHNISPEHAEHSGTIVLEHSGKELKIL